MDVYSSIVGFFQDGGLFMYPIVIVFALGAAIAIERWIYLTRASISSKSLWKQITPYLRAGKFNEAVSLINKSNAAIATVMSYGLKSVGYHAKRGMTWKRQWKRA